MRIRFTLFLLIVLLLSALSTSAAANTIFISGQVIDSATGQPVSGAVVAVGGVTQTRTDASGFYQFSYPVNDAYQLIKLRIKAEGFGVWLMPKVILYPGENRILPTAQLGTDRVTVEDTQLPGIFLRTEEDIAAAKSLGYIPDDGYLERHADPRSHVSHFVIPMTIKVGITPYIHCSDWLRAGQPVTQVIEMDFKEYVKNVLPNEWVHTWHPESLKAGAMAAKTFAWWRMTLTTTRPGGADVVDNTCDQVFWLNSRRASTDAAVDATWHLRISKYNRIPVVHYLAYDWQCAQAVWYPAEPCMGQWDSKYLAEGGMNYQQILHKYYDPILIDTTTTIIPNINVITNGAFTIDPTGWSTWGGIAGAGVTAGEYNFYRSAGSANAAVVYQDINTSIPANSPMRVRLRLGNSSSVSKTVTVHVHNVDSWNGATSCQFVIEPNMPLQNYTVWATNPTGWAAVRLEIAGESADGLPAYRLDSVSMVYKPVAPRTACTPPLPGKPVITSPIKATRSITPFNVTLTPGASNLRPDYADAFHIQISTSTSFEAPVFDNQASLAPDPVIPVNITTGAYYIRARQFDGIDRYSAWTKPIPFNAVQNPAPVSPVAGAFVDASSFDLTWNQTALATAYLVRIRTADGVKVAAKLFNSASVTCSDGLCSVNIKDLTTTPELLLFDDTLYRWDVQARTPYGRARAQATFTADYPIVTAR